MGFGISGFEYYEPCLSNMINIGGKEYLLSYRSDRESLEQESWYKPWMRFVLETHHVAIDRASGLPVVYDMFLKAVLEDSFAVLQFQGLSNSGKSWLAFAKAFQLIDLWYEVDDIGAVHIVQSWSKVLDMVGDGVRGDIIFCDEETKESGQDSKTNAEALENILSACRVKGISFFFLDPDPDPKPNVDFLIHIVARCKPVFYSHSLVYTPGKKSKLIGWDDTKLPVHRDFDSPKIITGVMYGETKREEFLVYDWDEFLEVYLPMKERHVDGLLDKKGILGTGTAAKQRRHAKILYDHAINQEVRITKQRLEMWISDLGMEGLTGDTRKQIVQRVIDKVEQDAVRIKRIDKDMDFGVKWKIEEISNAPLADGFLVELMPYLEIERQKYNAEKVRKGEKATITEDHLEWLKRWIEGASQADIGGDYGKSQAQVSNATRELRAKILGYAIEATVAKAHPDWKHVGGNSPEPDFETPDTIISVKGRCRDNIQINYEDFAKSERKTCIEEGKRLLMYYYELKHKKRFIIFEATIKSEVADDE